MKLTNVIYQTNVEKKVQNGEMNGHAVPTPEVTEPGMYIYCKFILFK